MDLNQVTVPCIDFEASLEFYRRLGLKLIVSNPPTYARFECPSGDSTFSIERVDQLPSGQGAVIYFEVEELDRKVQQLEIAGIVFDSPARDEPWLWREARLQDPAGNTICLFHAGKNRTHPPWRLRDT